MTRVAALLFGIGSALQAQAPAFDVASVKPNHATSCVRFSCGVTTMPGSGRLIVQYYSLLFLIRTAYGVREQR